MLDLSTLRKVAYPPERLIGATVQDIAAENTMVTAPFDMANLETTGLLLQLTDIATTPNANVVKVITADDFTQPPLSTALEPAGLPASGSWPAWKQLQYNLQNLSAATPVSAYQTDFGLWVMPLNPALKLRFQGADIAFSAEEAAIIDAIGEKHLKELVNSNLRPFDPQTLIARQDLTWHWYPQSAAPPVNASAGRTTVLNVSVPRGRVYALAALQIDATSGGTLSVAQQVANNLQVNVSRENAPDYDVFPAYAGSGFGRTFECWIPALTSLTVQLTAAANYASVPIRLLVADFPLSDIDRIRWRAATGAQKTATNEKLWNQVASGIL